ncbi:hypothetical protein KJ951_03730 [Patescibacteria group bacterium]|nr:hypothetical protein [Patescibacteria group bacterium]MBU1703487.1 hypothetical protein [Patescibacteria group bacterium]MBU1953699.1 hypothetical protein [Patescibacteria group bacterium]
MTIIRKYKYFLLAVTLSLAIALGSANTANASILFQDDSFYDVDSSGLLLDFLDQASGDIVIQFGQTLAETLKWSSANSRFELSDDLDLTNNQLTTARMENVSAMPGGGGGLGAAGTGRLVQLTTTDSIAPGCTGPSCTPGTYSWNGAIWVGLTGNTTVSNSTKIVTVGPIGRDYTNIAAAAAYLNTLSGGEMWIDPGTYPVTTIVDLANARIVGTGTGQTIAAISGGGKFLVKDTHFEDITISINAAITAAMGLDVKYVAASASIVDFDHVDAIINGSKVFMDSTAGTAPTAIMIFKNSTESSGTGNLLKSVATANLNPASNITVIDLLSSNPLKIVDWPVKIIGGSNVVTSGTITTVPDRTILVSPAMNIQAAVNSLGANGGVIKLLVGTHDITNEIIVGQNNIEILGEGPGTILRAQTGTWTGGTTSDNCAIQVGAANGSSPRTNDIIRNFNLQVGPNIHGICVNGGADNKITDMIVQSIGAKSNTRTGIVITDGAAQQAQRITVSRNIINNDTSANRWVDGVHFDGDAYLAGQLFGYGNGIRDSIISENMVSEARETCYAFSKVTASAIFSNRARNIGFISTALGMFVNNAQDIMVINNTMEGANAAATGIILYNDVDNTSVIGNAVRGGPANYSSGINNSSANNDNNIITGNQFQGVTTRIIDNGTNTKMEVLHHRSASNPAVNDDITKGYEIGTIWVNTTTDKSFILVDHTAGAAIWQALGGSGNLASSNPPAACTASLAGTTFMDTDSGIIYVCDTSNGRNKWLSSQDNSIWGDETNSCSPGQDPNSQDGCNVDWGDGIGPDGNSSLGFYLPYPITITGYGFSEDNDACSSGSFDLEVWSTGSASNDNDFSFESNIAAGLTGEVHNSNALNVNVNGGQYILWGVDNNCSSAMDDWNLVIYYRYRHP